VTAARFSGALKLKSDLGQRGNPNKKMVPTAKRPTILSCGSTAPLGARINSYGPGLIRLFLELELSGRVPSAVSAIDAGDTDEPVLGRGDRAGACHSDGALGFWKAVFPAPGTNAVGLRTRARAVDKKPSPTRLDRVL
jgi:hypothetical protein